MNKSITQEEVVYNNNDVYALGDSTIITPNGHGGQLMATEALLLALKNNRGVTSYPSLIDEVRMIIARLESIEGSEVIIVEADNTPISIEEITPDPIQIRSYGHTECIYKHYDKPNQQHRYGRKNKKSWSQDNRKKR